MKKGWFIIVLGIGACNSSNEGKTVAVKYMPGSVIAADSMRVVEDSLNDSYFSVKLLATDKSDKGTYAINAAWGFNAAATEFTMPKGGEQLQPVLRKLAGPYTFNIGFRQEGDTAFYDYYEIKGERGAIRMKYIKAYSFQ